MHNGGSLRAVAQSAVTHSVIELAASSGQFVMAASGQNSTTGL